MRQTWMLVVLLLLFSIARADETLVLTTPITAPSITEYSVASLTLNWEGQRIDIVLVEPGGQRYTKSYTGATATTLMVALNKLDLSVKSLQRRILERLAADGFLPGTISGTPK